MPFLGFLRLWTNYSTYWCTFCSFRGASCTPLHTHLNLVFDGIWLTDTRCTLYPKLLYVSWGSNTTGVDRDMVRDQKVKNNVPVPVCHTSIVSFHRAYVQNPVGRRLWRLYNMSRNQQPSLDMPRHLERLCRYWWL